ncbi:hypothetical protein VCRA2119O124_120171 [Vibrio crassostreae]|nr:hypothetical protein VCRA2119O124_120171 [Vibrio crassostreae]
MNTDFNREGLLFGLNFSANELLNNQLKVASNNTSHFYLYDLFLNVRYRPSQSKQVR